MPHRIRSARLAASLLSAVVAVLAFVAPSRAAATQAWAAPTVHRTAPDQVTTVRGPHAPDTPHAVRVTAAHHHPAHLPQPPFPGTTSTDRAPHRSVGGPAARLLPTTPAARPADPTPR
ncbi:hypothetical protein, partial [Streptomyces sp. NPDC059003]|uniref:hypothetical protein n=1 Tax=Streptomyces sp. NPDC059003 TaxID=3346691 RepID=UPI00369BA760